MGKQEDSKTLDVQPHNWIAIVCSRRASPFRPDLIPGQQLILTARRFRYNRPNFMQNLIDNHSSFLWITFPLYFASLWLLISAMLSFIAGWATLAKRFRCANPFTGACLTFQSGKMGMTNYSMCLTLGASPQGLYLAVMPPFRFRHPPLLIPWNEISVAPPRGLLFKFVRLGLGRECDIPLRLRPKIVEKLQQEAGEYWPTSIMQAFQTSGDGRGM